MRARSIPESRKRSAALQPQILILTCAITLGLGSACFAQRESQSDEAASQVLSEAPRQPTGAAVEIDGRAILFVYAPLAGIPPEERAEHIRERVINLARRNTTKVELIHAVDRDAWTEILADQEIIMAVTESDAKVAMRSRAQLGAEYAEVIRRTVATYRLEHTWTAILKGSVFSLLATVGFGLALWLLLRARRRVRRRAQEWVRETELGHSRDTLRARFARQLVLPLMGVGTIAVLVAVLALLEVYVTFLLKSFPSTRFVSTQIHRWTFSELWGLVSAIWSYLPNLVIVVVILVAAHYLIRLNKSIFAEIQEGKLTLRGFYPDWGAPTARLLRLLILAATAVVVFPYLPGSNSPAFRGISVFLGVLLSLGSTSAVSHGVAGTILTYMRSYSVGDFVRIGETVGEVVEKNLLVTRIRTQKNEIVTIPNGSVLGGVVTNYSVEARKNGVVFHTCVSIGYSAPWKKVHELLISAAMCTKDVLKSPSPFVLQSRLDDFYVSYELNAFTAQPQHMQEIYSELHQNIQDKFNEGGIEINSPHYTSLRDGNKIAVPDEYVPKNYKEPVFGIRDAGDSESFLRKPAGRMPSKANSSHP